MRINMWAIWFAGKKGEKFKLDLSWFWFDLQGKQDGGPSGSVQAGNWRPPEEQGGREGGLTQEVTSAVLAAHKSGEEKGVACRIWHPLAVKSGARREHQRAAAAGSLGKTSDHWQPGRHKEEVTQAGQKHSLLLRSMCQNYGIKSFASSAVLAVMKEEWAPASLAINIHQTDQQLWGKIRITFEENKRLVEANLFPPPVLIQQLLYLATCGQVISHHRFACNIHNLASVYLLSWNLPGRHRAAVAHLSVQVGCWACVCFQ